MRNFFKFNDTGSLKEKGWKKMYHANVNLKKIEIVTLISYKLQRRKLTIDNEGHYIKY